MAKKKAVKKTVAPKALAEDAVAIVRIAPLPTDFGREDLNLMAAKINEIISTL